MRKMVARIILFGLLAAPLQVLFGVQSIIHAQVIDPKQITLTSQTPVLLTSNGEPEMAAAISGNKVIITSGSAPSGNDKIYVWDISSNITKVYSRPPGSATYNGYGNDTLIARLADGQFLLSAQGAKTSSDQGGVKVTYASGLPAEVMWRSLTGDTWSSVSALVSSLVNQGYCAQLPPGKGGFDRPELYADLWGKTSAGSRVFMTTACVRSDDVSLPLFVSDDSGKTWSNSTINLEGNWTPAVMIASESRLFFAQCINVGSGPERSKWDIRAHLSWSDDRGKSLTPPDPSTPDAKFLDITQPGSQCGWTADPGIAFNKPSYALVRTKDPAVVLFAYPSVEKYDSTHERQILQVMMVNTRNRAVTLYRTIRPTSSTGSILHFSFIDDPRPSPSGDMISLIYWVETDAAIEVPPQPWKAETKWPTPVTAHAKYSLFIGRRGWTEPVELSSAGWTIPFPSLPPVNKIPKDCGSKDSPPWPQCAETWYGDYMKGGSAVNGNSIRFATAWPECTAQEKCALKAQVVSVNVAGSTQPGTVAALPLSWKTAPVVKATQFNPAIHGPAIHQRTQQVERQRVERKP